MFIYLQNLAKETRRSLRAYALGLCGQLRDALALENGEDGVRPRRRRQGRPRDASSRAPSLSSVYHCRLSPLLRIDVLLYAAAILSSAFVASTCPNTEHLLTSRPGYSGSNCEGAPGSNNMFHFGRICSVYAEMFAVSAGLVKKRNCTFQT